MLPNDSDSVRAAQAAARTAEGDDGIRVAVIPTEAQVQGLAALAVHEPGRPFDQDVLEMTATARHARHGAVTIAARQAMTMAGPCEPGDVLGVIAGDFAVVGSELDTVAAEVLERLLAGGGELVTIVAGEGGEELASQTAASARERHAAVDVMVYDGGQERYPLLISRRMTRRTGTHRDRSRLAADHRGRRQGHQAQTDGRGPRPADRRRPAAAFPAPLRQGRRAHPGRRSAPGRDAHRRRRDRRERPQHLPGPPHPPAGVPPRHRPGDRRPQAADVVLRQELPHRAVERRPPVGGPARRLRRPGQHLPQPVAAHQPDGWSSSALRPATRARTAVSSTPSARSTRSTHRPRASTPGTSSAP